MYLTFVSTVFPVKNLHKPLIPANDLPSKSVQAKKDEVLFQGRVEKVKKQISNQEMLFDFKNGNLNASGLKSRIKEGADINAQDEQGDTILHYVTRDCFGNGSLSDLSKYLKELRAVLTYKPNVNITNKKDETPLSIVINLTKFLNWPDAIKLLLDNGALLRQKDKPDTLSQPESLRYGQIPRLLSEYTVKQLQRKKGRQAYFNNTFPGQQQSQDSSSQINFLHFFKKRS